MAVFYLLSAVWAVFMIVLTFKVWWMCNDIQALRNHFVNPENPVDRSSRITISFVIIGFLALLSVLIWANSLYGTY